MKQNFNLSSFKGIAFDLDGVIWRGEKVVPGAAQAVAKLRANGASLTFVTNNAGQHRSTQLEKLRSMSIDAELAEVITSGSASVGYISKQYPNCSVFVLGTDDLKREVLDRGLTLIENSPGTVADCVIVGFDKSFNYEKLNNAFQHLRLGAKFIACNENNTYPVEDGLRPGTGAIVAAVSATIGRGPDLICGKPHLPIFEETLQILGTPPAESLFISDSIEHDLIGAERVGMATLFVLSGVGTMEDLDKHSFKPDFILNSVAEILL